MSEEIKKQLRQNARDRWLLQNNECPYCATDGVVTKVKIMHRKIGSGWTFRCPKHGVCGRATERLGK